MPLRDHFHPPVDKLASWEGFHAMWPVYIVDHLQNILPAGYVAEPRVHLGSQAEIDVATFEQDDALFTTEPEGDGGVATAVWAPAQPTLAVETALPGHARYEVRVYDLNRGRQLVAAVEIVSPANKDRPDHRKLFVAKCAALLQQGVAVSVVDLVTERHFNLYAETLAFIGHSDPTLGDAPPPLYAASARWVRRGQRTILQAWSHVLTVGQPLPTLPLWLREDHVIPLRLEDSYEQACRTLRLTGPVRSEPPAAGRRRGDDVSDADPFPAVYDELRRLAAARLAAEPAGHTLDPTALVHEAFLRLRDAPGFADHAHLVRAAAEAMRRILVDHARRKHAGKRGGRGKRFVVSEADRVAVPDPDTLLAIDEALETLTADDPAAAEVARLRLFAGLSVEEAGDALGVSRATAFRDWAYARAWLTAALRAE